MRAFFVGHLGDVGAGVAVDGWGWWGGRWLRNHQIARITGNSLRYN